MSTITITEKIWNLWSRFIEQRGKEPTHILIDEDQYRDLRYKIHNSTCINHSYGDVLDRIVGLGIIVLWGIHEPYICITDEPGKEVLRRNHIIIKGDL